MAKSTPKSAPVSSAKPPRKKAAPRKPQSQPTKNAIKKPTKKPITVRSSSLSPSAISTALAKSFSPNTVSDHTVSTTNSLRTTSTASTSSTTWERGDIIHIPYLIPALGQATSPAYVTHSTNTGPIIAKMRHAIIIAVLPSNILALPIYTSTGNNNGRKPSTTKLTSMSVLPPADAIAPVRASDPNLFIEGTGTGAKAWTPKPHSYINLTDVVTVHYKWSLSAIDKLDARSSAILAQRCRIAHNMVSIPRGLQRAYFRTMVTREPILAPGPPPEGRAAEEFHVGGAEVDSVPGLRPRGSNASENENLLNDDLGYGIMRGQHDMDAARKLIEWKPSLAMVLTDNVAGLGSSGTMNARSRSYSVMSSPKFADEPSEQNPSADSGKGKKAVKQTGKKVAPKTTKPTKKAESKSKSKAKPGKVAKTGKDSKKGKSTPAKGKKVEKEPKKAAVKKPAGKVVKVEAAVEPVRKNPARAAKKTKYPLPNK